MNATGWKGGTYGVRVGSVNASKFFRRTWQTVELEIDGEFHVFELSPKFWGKCPEIRGAAIGEWFMRRGLAPWPTRKPPQLTLEPLGDSRFRLRDR